MIDAQFTKVINKNKDFLPVKQCMKKKIVQLYTESSKNILKSSLYLPRRNNFGLRTSVIKVCYIRIYRISSTVDIKSKCAL